MANQIASFASGSNLVIRFGKIAVAYGTNLSFTDDVSHGSVGGIGSYSYDAIEPLQYLARGSFSVMRYSSDVQKALDSMTPKANPQRAQELSGGSGFGYDGNSLLQASQFNPADLLLSRSFDIDVYERTGGGASADLQLVFKLQDCRLTSYSITFNPGSLISENVGFLCIKANDKVAQGEI